MLIFYQNKSQDATIVITYLQEEDMMINQCSLLCVVAPNWWQKCVIA